MSVALAVWSIELTPGKEHGISPAADIRITNAALGATLEDESKRTSVRLVYQKPNADEEEEEEEEEEGEDDEKDEEDEDEDDGSIVQTILCSLTPGKIEQTNLDIILDSESEYVFEVTGPNTVYLTGNYISQSSDEPPYDESDEEDDYDDEGLPLEDFSSDVEEGPDGLSDLEDDADRFEEVDEEEEAAPATSSKKRARESDAHDEDEASKKLSKAEKKKLKKLKGQDGSAVEAPTTAAAPKAEKGKEKQKEKKEQKKDVAGEVKTLPSGTKVKDVVVGKGQQAKKGSILQLRYIGKLDNGKVFDSNTKGKPFEFRLGAGDVIKGWDEGLVGMTVGGERILTIPPKAGYGNRKMGGIPAGSTLTFECKLVGIKP